MKKLFNQELSNWPQLAPIQPLDLLNTPIDEGPWAMAETPKNFAKKHELLTFEIPEGNTLARDGYKVTVSKSKAKELFTLQLGPLWEGVEHLPPHRKALFAIFAAKMNRDDKGAMALAHQISRSASGKAFNFTGVDALLSKYWDTKLT